MRNWLGGTFVALALISFACARQQAAQTATRSGADTDHAPAQSRVEEVLASKVRSEWEALKKKDRAAYGGLLADDFVGVEDDGDGTRNRLHAINEIETSNVYSYTISFFKLLLLAPGAALVSYEVTMEFPPKAAVRYKRMYISEAWMKDNGEWKLRHYQETRVR